MDTGTTVSAAYLQARINILILQLRARMLNLVGLLAASTGHDGSTVITDTATEQLRMEVESTALIGAAEEIMVLTRELKDLWLFGGLDALHGHEKDKSGTAGDEAMEQDAKVVYDFVRSMMHGHGDAGTEVGKMSSSVVDVMEVEENKTT